jgi:uncharacterized RDD family membrane protein YckC
VAITVDGPALNPYQAPRSDLDPGQSTSGLDAALATRWQRLGGSILDGLLQLAVHFLIYLGIPKREVMAADGNLIALYLHHGPWGYLVGAALLGLMIAQWFFISQRGQTIGKMATGTRVVRMDGTAVGFFHGVVLRSWPFTVPGLIFPLVGIRSDSPISTAFFVATVIEVLFIFGAGRRCVHDLIAGTKVIAVR